MDETQAIPSGEEKLPKVEEGTDILMEEFRNKLSNLDLPSTLTLLKTKIKDLKDHSQKKIIIPQLVHISIDHVLKPRLEKADNEIETILEVLYAIIVELSPEYTYNKDILKNADKAKGDLTDLLLVDGVMCRHQTQIVGELAPTVLRKNSQDNIRVLHVQYQRADATVNGQQSEHGHMFNIIKVGNKFALFDVTNPAFTLNEDNHIVLYDSREELLQVLAKKYQEKNVTVNKLTLTDMEKDNEGKWQTEDVLFMS